MRPFFDALALRLKLTSPSLNRLVNGITLGVHLVAWLVLVRLTHEPLWWSLPLLWAILPALVSYKTRQFQPRLESLTPMALAYGVLGVRIGLALVARANGTTTGGLEVPQPYGNALDMSIFIILSLLWVWASQLGLVAEAFGYTLNRERSLNLLAAGILVIAFGWATRTYFDVRTHGVTASDPYAYVQMGYDLATNGTPEHHFDLTTLVNQAEIDRYALVPIGYRTPDTDGNAATVWAVGYSALLAVAYQVSGESGFYLLTPVLGLLSMVATGVLVIELLRERAERWLAASIAVFVLATSLLQFIWLAIPMADIPAQLFSTLALLLALRAMRGQPLRNAFLAGICLGIAFAIRYTQVLLGVSLVLAFTIAYPPRQIFQQWLKVMVSAGIGAWLVAGWVLWYHQQAFGSPLKVGSQELELFAVQWLDDSAWRMLQDLFSQPEFLWILPFMLIGIGVMVRQQPHHMLIIGSGLAAVILFHLPYQYLRLRDLLSIFPLLAIWVGMGTVALMQWAEQHYRGVGRVTVLALLAVALWLRTYDTLQITHESFNNFGYITAPQRESFEELERQTPADAIIAASLHVGAIQLYTERETIRPYEWESDEWQAFLNVAGERPVYLLADGFQMASVFDNLSPLNYTVEEVGRVELPYFHPGGGSTNQTITLYHLRRNE